MFEGTFYLTKVDDKYRRFYEVKKGTSTALMPSNNGVECAKTSAERRLVTLENHFAAFKGESSSPLRSVMTNFHKKPLQERLNEV